ncbi:amidohydrolase [Mycobacterium shinjukuense]|uniref:Amidohydrolase n=1 Tax=Mycobacterium shinjukuense TaxID=398694 RepID=A0A7I7MNR5_9MYCO|nr:amidohydrolase [Mycobacterium shinjukuense]MCV6986966.1 amidohydrolase [Mycobacterium shinjukuense]ORB71138.1 twin-arginine translocation pathway signal protein [Mycobacterium shinjukuense]BBX73590.1 amidohydrolase [Mycobacterium shinjukuense]
MCTNCQLMAAFEENTVSSIGELGGAGSAARADGRTGPADSASASDGVATVVFRRGAVYTLDPSSPWAEAVAVRGRHIVAVGSNAEVSARIGPATRVVELDGRMLLPGFVEAHIHPIVGAFFTPGVDLQLPSRSDALAAISAYARDNPSGTVRGFGWRVDMFPPDGPSRNDLDRIVPDRPAVLFSIDAHSAWVNSMALEIAGVTSETPDPVPGFSFYQRDPAGHPTGYVLELPAVLGIVGAIEPVTKAAMTTLLADWAPRAAAAGITAVFDAGMPPEGNDPDGLATVYTDLERQGRLPFRVVVSHIVKAPPIDDAVARTVALRQRFATELVRGGVLKIIGDGTAEGHTAYLLAPYADKPDSIGQSPFSEDDWRRLVVDADAADIDVHVHAIGDRTVRVALDAIEAAIKTNPPRERRHSIAHLVYVDDTDVPRFGELGVIAQFSGNWMSADPSTVDIALERYGPRRQQRFFRPRAVLETGATIAFGTDWPAAGYFSTYKPLDAVQIAVTRQLIGRPDAPILEPADQRLDLAQALHAATLGAARQLRLDGAVGSVQAGKLADLVVLRRNLFDVSATDIASTPVDMTMMNGTFTHGA